MSRATVLAHRAWEATASLFYDLAHDCRLACRLDGFAEAHIAEYFEHRADEIVQRGVS